MIRERLSVPSSPVISPLLDIGEKRRAHERHTKALNEINLRQSGIDCSHPPKVPRIALFEQLRARNRLMQLRSEDENIRSIHDVYRRVEERQKTAKRPQKNEKKWCSVVKECEGKLTVTTKQDKSQSTVNQSYPEG